VRREGEEAWQKKEKGGRCSRTRPPYGLRRLCQTRGWKRKKVFGRDGGVSWACCSWLWCVRVVERGGREGGREGGRG
jgi:hypothetical protein